MVVYLQTTDISGNTQTSLETKVAPIKRLSIPRLELCGSQLHVLAQLMHHVRNVPLNRVYAWTDSTIVINWLDGSPKNLRRKQIVDLLPPDKW